MPASRTRKILASVCLLLFGGCGYSQGELFYFMGLGRGQEVQAKFRLTQGPILILIDDDRQQVSWPAARRYLFEDLAQELLQHEAAGKIIPSQTLEHLRQTMPDFEKRGCREMGKRAGAEQVVWIEVEDFHVVEDIEDAIMAAHFSVSIKVINVLEEKKRSRVRLWPVGRRGHLMTVSMTGSEVAAAKTKDAISKVLTNRLAVDMAKLFYDHRLAEFELEK